MLSFAVKYKIIPYSTLKFKIMEEFLYYAKLFFVVFAAIAFFAGAWMIADNFGSWSDFFKTFKDKEYNYLSFVFRKGKHLRFVTDFPKDLRNACLGEESYYADKEGDDEEVRKAKVLVRRLLCNDTIIREYFTGQYFTYEDFLEVRELCDVPDYDETSALLDQLASHLKHPKSAMMMKELIVDVMTTNDVDYKAGKREAVLLKAMERSDNYNHANPWEQKEFAEFMIKLGINTGKFQGKKESTIGSYSADIQKKWIEELNFYVADVQRLIDKKTRHFIAKS